MTDIQVGSVSELGIDSSAVRDFYRLNWKRPIALADEKFYAWQFTEAPYSKSVDHCVAALKEGQLVGIMGATPWPFVLDGKAYHAAMLTTWIVSEAARGLGLGKKIIQYLCDEYEILLGASITEAALPIYIKSGFQYIAAIPRFVRILDIKNVRPYANISAHYESLFGDPDRPANDFRPAYKNEAAVLPIPGLHGYRRDNTFMQWRYDNHPYYKYKTTSYSGFTVVYRLQDLLAARSMHVVDILGAKEDITDCLQHIEALGRAENASFIDYMQINGAHQACLRDRRWLSAVDDYYARVMHLFSPPEMRSPPTTSFVFWARERDVHKVLCRYEHLYLSKADIDLDRPTLDYIGSMP